MQGLMETGGVLKLPNEQNVHFKIKRNGQQDPSLGNNVITLLVVGLNAMEDTYTNKELHFGDKCSFINEKLVFNWGSIDRHIKLQIANCRTNYVEFIAKTYSEGFEQAELFLDTEIQKLNDIISERVMALINADN